MPGFMIVNDLPPDRRTFFHDHAPAAGTWRPAPPGEGGGPGTYATSLPMLIARAAGLDARAVAARLAVELGQVPWIASARVSGPGYLTVTVTTRHLTALPARIVAAERRTAPVAPPLPDPAAAPGWPDAWRTQRDVLVLRLTGAAGLDDLDDATERHDKGDRRRLLTPLRCPNRRAARWRPRWRGTGPTRSGTPWPGPQGRGRPRSSVSSACRSTWTTRSCWSGTRTPTPRPRPGGRPTSPGRPGQDRIRPRPEPVPAAGTRVRGRRGRAGSRAGGWCRRPRT